MCGLIGKSSHLGKPDRETVPLNPHVPLQRVVRLFSVFNNLVGPQQQLLAHVPGGETSAMGRCLWVGWWALPISQRLGSSGTESWGRPWPSISLWFFGQKEGKAGVVFLKVAPTGAEAQHPTGQG
jgi:hypothetical protein